MKLTIITLFAAVLLAACAPNGAGPATTAMPNPAPTTGAMTSEPTATAVAMMQTTPTPDAMMQAAPTTDAMMPHPTGTAEAMMTPDRMMAGAPAETMAAHVVSMSPKHAQLLDERPDQITITFDAPLAPSSTITVAKDGTAIAVGKTTLGDKNLSMSVSLPATAGDGIYMVKYTACQSDQMCSNGQYAFQVDLINH